MSLSDVRNCNLEKLLLDGGYSLVILFHQNDGSTIRSEDFAVTRQCKSVLECHSAKVIEGHESVIIKSRIFDNPLGILSAKWHRRAEFLLYILTVGQILNHSFASCSGIGNDCEPDFVTRVDGNVKIIRVGRIPFIPS